MVTLAVLTADQRLSYQIHSWLKDLADSVRWETHADLAAFASKIQTENAAEILAKAKSAKDDAILDAEDIGSGKSQSVTDVYYRLLIVDLDLLQSNGVKPVEWARSIKELLLARERSDLMFPTRILFLAFEGGHFKVDEFRDLAIDDLVLKPLDRSVFLQKVEFLISDKPNVKPTFLFRQETDITIEVGKDAVIDEVSEFSLAIRNPTHLSNGVYAAIHSSLLGEAQASRIIGRVYKSEEHPTVRGQALVRFAFFGLRADQHANVKKYVRDRQPPPKARPPQPPMSENDPTVPFNRVAVIDMDADVYTDIDTTVRDHFVGVKTTHYLSYARLLAALKQFYTGTEAAPAAPNALPDDSHGLQAWTSSGPLQIETSGTELMRFVSPLTGGDHVFGLTPLEHLQNPKALFKDLDKHDANELQELMTYTASGGKGRSFLKMKDGANRLFYVEAKSSLVKPGEGESPALIRIELKQIEKADFLKNSPEQLQPADLMYDAIFIDVTLIRGEMKPWFDGLVEAYMKAGIVVPGGAMPKIILLADDKSRASPDQYRFKFISDFIYKPLERKVLAFKTKVAANDLIPRKEPEIAPFVRAEAPAKLARDAQMLELSEYGLSIASSSPFKKGAMMRFFSPLLGGGADGVLGRCSHCDQEDGNPPTYVCHFVFFGTPDEILKGIRTWIREDYVHRKEAP